MILRGLKRPKQLSMTASIKDHYYFTVVLRGKARYQSGLLAILDDYDNNHIQHALRFHSSPP